MSRMIVFIVVAPWLLHSEISKAQELPPTSPGTVIVHLGATDGALELRLAKSGVSLVHALTSDQKTTDSLRARFGKEKVSSVVTVGRVRDWKTLPYPDQFVNHLVADLDFLGAGPSAEEIERVLVSGGSAILRKGGTWRTTKRPASNQIDDWSHKWYDPTGNPVSKDKVAAGEWIISHEELTRIRNKGLLPELNPYRHIK